MTEVADQFTAARPARLTRINALDRRQARRRRRPAAAAPSTTRRPASRRGAVDFASVEEVDAAVAGREGARSPAWRALSLVAAHRALLPHPRARSTSIARSIARLLTRRARQGALRRDGRGRARARGDRVLLRDPAAAEGRASPSRPRPGSTSTRSASRSASSPGSRRSTSRRWCRCGCGRRRSPAATRSCSSRPRRIRRRRCCTAELLKEAGLPDGVFNVVHGDKVAVDALLEHPDVAAVSLRRLDADRALRLRDRHAGTASACRRSAGRRTT